MAIEREIVNEMQRLDMRGLPLLSQEEMDRSGIYYDEGSGTYKNKRANQVSVTVPGDRPHTFTSDEHQFLRVNPDQYYISEDDYGIVYPYRPGTKPYENYEQFYPDDMYRPGSPMSDFYEDQDFIIPPMSSYEGIEETLGSPWTPLAYRAGVPFDRRGHYDLTQYQNLAHYLDQVIDMPHTQGELSYMVDDSGELISYGGREGGYMAQDAKRKAIDQMTNIHLQGIENIDNPVLGGYDTSDVFLQEGAAYDPNVKVTDILRGLKETRDESRWHEEEINPYNKKQALASDEEIQTRLGETYEAEKEGWWLGKYVGRPNPDAQVIINRHGRYERK